MNIGAIAKLEKRAIRLRCYWVVELNENVKIEKPNWKRSETCRARFNIENKLTASLIWAIYNNCAEQINEAEQ